MPKVERTLSIVQFIHPGREHRVREEWKHDKEFPWNSGDHARKFLSAPATYVDWPGSSPLNGEVVFWGEWEPPSSFAPVVPTGESDAPVWVHEPFMPAAEPPERRQNTDPLVFGEHFIYSNCKQFRKNGRPTALNRLAQGSLILFGSCRAEQFRLDTVLVVAQLHLLVPAERRGTYGDDLFIDAAIRPHGDWNAQLSIYQGSQTVPEGELFSFVPCRSRARKDYAFQRPVIDPIGALHGRITPKLRQGQKITKATSDQVAQAWHEVVAQVSDADLSLGTAFATPPRREI